MGATPVALRSLTSRSGLRRTLAAYALFDLVEIAIWLAIILYAFDRGGAPLAGVVGVLQLLPAVVLAPPLASVGDRMPRGTALALAHGGVAATTVLTLVALLVEAPVVVVITASATSTIALAVVRPIHFAALPQLARTADELVSANSVSSVADGIAYSAGPVLAGFGAAIAGPWLVFAGGSAAAVMATLLCLQLGLPAPTPDERGDKTDRGAKDEGFRAALAGLRTMWGDWAALALLLVLSTRFVIGGAMDVLGVSFSTSVLGLGQSGAGLIIGALGIGGILGASVAATVSRRKSLVPVVIGGGVLLGAGVAVVAFFDRLAPAMFALALAGMGGALLIVGGRTLLQRVTDDRVLARVFAIQESTSLLGIALGTAVSPLLIHQFSADGAFIPIGVGIVLVTVVTFTLVRRLDARAVFRPEELALLRGIPFLSVLPPYEFERLAKNARWLNTSSGEEVVRQGQPGHEFFVIAAGEFTVTIEASPLSQPMTTGTGFGEIALLGSVARTATVTSLTPGRLLVVSSVDFLAAVTGSPGGRAIAAEVSASHLARDRAREVPS